jgi:DNA-nicking Smr family endonuclease
MSRRLSREDRELWDRLRRQVKPLRRAPDVPPAPEGVEGASGTVASPRAAAATTAPTPSPRPAHWHPEPPAEPPLTPLEERSRRRLARGLADVDGRIDLHGMRQDRAFSALLGFLRQSQARGFRTVLVITGKGKESLDFPAGEGRGVLRQSVPAWLARPDLRDLVLGFEEAGRRHGGGGALYVRLRRRRAASRPPQP